MHGDRASAGLQRRAMGHGVDSAGEAADDGDAVRCEAAGHLLGDLTAVDGDAARADDGDAPLVGCGDGCHARTARAADRRSRAGASGTRRRAR